MRRGVSRRVDTMMVKDPPASVTVKGESETNSSSETNKPALAGKCKVTKSVTGTRPCYYTVSLVALRPTVVAGYISSLRQTRFNGN